MDNVLRFFTLIHERRRSEALHTLTEMSSEELASTTKALWEARAVAIEYKKRLNRVHGVR